MSSNTHRGVRAETVPPASTGDALPSEGSAPAPAHVVPLRRPAPPQTPVIRDDDPGDDPGPQAA